MSRVSAETDNLDSLLQFALPLASKPAVILGTLSFRPVAIPRRGF